MEREGKKRKRPRRLNINGFTSHASLCTKEISEAEWCVVGTDYDYLDRADGNVHESNAGSPHARPLA